jgi:hypothetical protein
MKTILILALLVVSACATTQPTVKTEASGSLPSWVNQPQASYPENRYLVAVGNGRDRNAAIEDAKKQMAESFVVKVKSELQSKAQSNLNQDTSGSLSGDSSENTAKNLSLSTETSLRGAEVKEVTQVGSDFYSLVALDKLKARSGLLLEGNRLKGKLESSLDALDSNYTTQKMAEAKSQLADLEQLYGEASALGMSALIDVNPLEVRLNKIENAARNRTAKILFAVKTIKGETFFERDIEACINDRGGTVYTFDQAPKNSNKVQITVVERPQHLPIQGWTKIRFDLTAAVVQEDGKMFRVQTTQTETGRSRDAVLESVSDKLSHDFCESLFNRMNEAR